MNQTEVDPKAGEKAYYARLGAAGMVHARNKPFSDADCGKYLSNFGALFQMIEPAPRSVLDLGCGTGWTSLFLARAGYDVVGVDISTDAIEAARATAKEQRVDRVEFVAADYEELRLNRAFDYVLFYDALHHAEDEAKALEVAHAALKPGGVLFAFEPGVGHSRSDGAAHAVATYQVHEKDMPPKYIWQLGRKAGFRRRLFLPLPHEVGRGLYRRDFLRASGSGALWAEKLWGYWRLVTKLARVRSSGITVMWK